MFLILTTPRTTRKPSPFLLFLFTFLLILFFSLSWVSAQEEPKPKPQSWQIDGIMAALDDSYPQVKKLALDKLGEYELQDWKSVPGKRLEDVAKIAADLLKDKTVESDVRYGAVEALGKLGDAAKPYIKDIIDILKDKTVETDVRLSAVKALGNLGDTAKPYVKDIADILKDKNVDPSVRSSAVEALGNLGDAAKPYVKDIIDILKDKEVVIILDNVYYDGQSFIPQWRFLTYFLGGGTDEVKTLLKWLGYSQKTHDDQLSNSEGVKTLQVFLQAWKNSHVLQQSQADLARQIAAVTKKATWKWQDIKLLQSHHQNLKTAGFTEADTVQSVINELEFWKWFFLATKIILIHLAIWFFLILAYPKSPQIQTIFWNSWLRRILGFGYIGLLLTSVPYLRRRLFEPFKPILLADAGLDNFNEQTYFPESFVKIPPGSTPPLAPPPQSPQRGEPPHGAALRKRGGVKQAGRNSVDNLASEIQSVTQALPNITGQIVLEGDSGLGKSMFLRHLVKTSQRTVAFLPAQKCDDGVISAIYAKLQGQVQDAEFLRNLIYYGGIDICIDGLNEVTADTRAKVSQFVESYFQGNIIMTTQPLDWIPPSTAKKYELQPLEREQIQQFLLSRQQNLTQRDRASLSEIRNLTLPYRASLSLVRRGKSLSARKSETPLEDKEFRDYEQACSDYIAAAFSDQQSPEDLAAAKRILSNPMDLTLVALMLSQGKQPDLFRLQEQQYQLMAAEYLREWKHEFPLHNFSQAVYQMRLNDESAIPADEFRQELISMEDEKYKMVVSRQWEDVDGEAQKSWYFRHDKIMEFFLVQNFLGEDEEVQQRVNLHVHEPRFRGVYLLLANLLSLDAALELREKLIEYAANTKDHTLTDKFVQLLKLRLPQQWTQDGTLKQLLQQQEQKTKYLDLVTQFLQPVGAKIKRENSLHLTIETIEGSLSPYTPLPLLLTIDTPTDKDVIQLVQISEKLANANLTPPTPLPYEGKGENLSPVFAAEGRGENFSPLLAGEGLGERSRIGILFYKVSPDTTARMETADDRGGDETMQNFPIERPFDNFRVAITDPSHFFGRSELLNTMLKSPFQVRILLAGRRLGKTSALRAIEWNLLNPNTSYPRRAFPVLINLQLEQPKDLDNLRYLLIARLREATERWREVPLAGMRQMYHEFLSQVKSGEVTLSFLKQLNIKFNINNPDHEQRLNNDSFRLAFLKTIEELRKLNFQGVCFLIDGAEFIVRQNWASDAWSYLRGLKDTDTAIKPFLGLLLSGYRDLKEYQQRVGSPLLNIAEIEWLTSLSEEETEKLIGDRTEQEQISLTQETIASIMEWSGSHPYLIQQTLNIIFDYHHQGESRANLIENLINKLLQHHDKDFSAWWNAEQHSGCFGETERTVYHALVENRKGTSKTLAQCTGLSRGEIADSLEVIAGTGVIRLLDDESYAVGSRLFEEWVTQQTA